MITHSISCPLGNCPKSTQCPRHASYLKALAENDVLTVLNTTKITVGPEGCEHFLVPKPIRLAYGFKKLYNSIPAGNVRYFSIHLPFGSDSSYYRAKRGERELTPDEQAAILRAVRKAGGDPSVGFDRYVDSVTYVRVHAAD